MKELIKKIKTKKAVIGVIGLGYVGLPLAMAFVKKGFNVIGIDISESRIKKLKCGVSYISDVSDKELAEIMRLERFEATSDFKSIKNVDAAIICVPTPLRKKYAKSGFISSAKEPDISYIRKAVNKVRDNIKKGQIVVLESTTYPGTTKEILLPVLESTGLKEGVDFYLAFSPERIDPGNKIYKTENTPKVIGGMSPNSTEIAALLYGQIINKVIPVSSANAAEMVKLLENTFRIVNTALVNEIAVLCNRLKLDIWEIIDAAKTKPYGYMPFYPGPGVGGHCIPIDPLYLSWKAKKYGVKTKFINLASSVNEAMPSYIVKRLTALLSKRKKKLENAKVLILGVAYKKDVKDLRESPALRIINMLRRRRVKVYYFDRQFPYLKLHGINMKPAHMSKSSLEGFDAAILVTDHSDFDYKFLARHLRLILDTRNIFGKLGIKSANIVKL